MLNLNILSLLALTLANFMPALLTGVISLCLGGFIGIIVYKKVVVAKTIKAKETAEKIVEDAKTEASVLKKEAILDAKEQASKIKDDVEQECKQRRLEVQKAEERLNSREDFINNKEETLDKKQNLLDEAKLNLQKQEQEIELLKQSVLTEKQKVVDELEKVSGLTHEEAKQLILNEITETAKKEAAASVRQIEQSAKDEAEKKARNIISLAIQKCATDVTSDATVSAITLPNDEMKGRLIGREGRNIKAIEAATGVDLIVDDTPDTVIISCFEPVRREVARIAIEKLMMDGRIHPTRIEEMVEKVKRDLEQEMKQAGEDAVFDAEISGMHPELIKLLGRLKYRTSYGQNVLKHSMEVSYIAGLMAAEIGANIKVAKRGGLLHDIGKAIDHEVEGTHVEIGVDMARRFKENEQVIHCIEAHHGDVEFNSIEAVLVQAADAISSARPGARRESLDNYIKRLERLEGIANSVKGVEKSFAIQAGREIRIIVNPTEVDDNMTVFIAKDIAKQIESELEYPGQIKVNVIREVRTVDYAK